MNQDKSKNNTLEFYVINMDKDKSRLITFTEQMNAQGLAFTRHMGPLIKTQKVSFFGRSYKVRARGYIGVALAHLTLWEQIAEKGEDGIYYNILEDDEVIRENYKEKILAEINNIQGKIDFFNLSVIRPMGTEMYPGILKITNKKFSGKTPNIWLGSYIITAGGAQKILYYFSKEIKDLNKNFDRILVRILHKHNNEINSYVLQDREKHSMHYEVESSKKEINNYHFIFRVVKKIKQLLKSNNKGL